MSRTFSRAHVSATGIARGRSHRVRFGFSRHRVTFPIDATRQGTRQAGPRLHQQSGFSKRHGSAWPEPVALHRRPLVARLAPLPAKPTTESIEVKGLNRMEPSHPTARHSCHRQSRLSEFEQNVPECGPMLVG